MLPVGWLVAVVLVAIVLTMWVTFTLTRLDRLHARVDAAQAALDAQLVRRAAALQHLAQTEANRVPPDLRARCERSARAALDPEQDAARRQAVENAVGRAVAELSLIPDSLRAEDYAELREAATRVLISRRFYNDAVRDTRALRARRLPRLFRMAGRRAMPEFFDIDDTLPASAAGPPITGTLRPTGTTPTPTTEEDRP